MREIFSGQHSEVRVLGAIEKYEDQAMRFIIVIDPSGASGPITQN
jgi:hypothetical protein